MKGKAGELVTGEMALAAQVRTEPSSGQEPGTDLSLSDLPFIHTCLRHRFNPSCLHAECLSVRRLLFSCARASPRPASCQSAECLFVVDCVTPKAKCPSAEKPWECQSNGYHSSAQLPRYMSPNRASQSIISGHHGHNSIPHWVEDRLGDRSP